MKRLTDLIKKGIFCLAALFLIAGSALAQQPDKKEIIESVKHSVVNIRTNVMLKPSVRRQPTFSEALASAYIEKSDLIREKFPVRYEGTGIVIDKEGLILTNAHVVSKFDVIEVETVDGKNFHAVLINKDEKKDLALLKVTEAFDWQAIQMADPSLIKSGETVYAIGNPFSYGHSVTEGVVSATGRKVDFDSEHIFEDMIQTTADVNSGNSGGPLVDSSGRMFGIMTISDRRARGINFAISVETIRKLLPSLKTMPAESKEYDALKKQFGFSVREEKENGESRILIDAIGTHGAAYKAGLRTNDEIVQVKDTKIRTLADLLKAAAEIKQGSLVRIEIKRSDRALFTQVEAK